MEKLILTQKIDYRILGSGKTTVVVETGLGNSYFDWLPVAEYLSEKYTVVLYHRQGYGDSDITQTTRSTYNIASELNDFVTELKIENFILLAHSFGGLCAQHYNVLFPNKLGGMILLDSASPRLVELENLETPFLNEHCSIEVMISLNMDFSNKTIEEMKHLQDKSIKRNREILSKEDMTSYINFVTSKEFNVTVAKELSEWINSGLEIQKVNHISHLPTLIICRDEQLSVDNWATNGVPRLEAKIHEKHWHLLQNDLKKISTNSELIIARGCDHMIHLENPKVIYDALDHLNKMIEMSSV